MAFRRVPLSFFFFLFLIASSQSLEFKKKHKIKGPIKTLVVIIMENRSFDHIYGWLKATRPDIDGLDGDESNRVVVTNPDSEVVKVSNDALFIDSDPGHSFQAIREQIFGSNDSTREPLMNGFAQQAESENLGMSRTVMSGLYII
ncbi:non-specific phospholipase c1 [Quercus suber]|uniref:Non-specific phospholipase c1 n=1 Tax=Quercus suber TaxID=58331 RepID=A0AAW0IIB0_QUESU